MTEDELLYAVLDDKIRECENNNYLSNTNFLDIYQQSKAIQYLQKFHIKHVLYGGFEESERKIVIFLPDYADDEFLFECEDLPIVPLRIDKDNFSTLSHRDYLGAIMGLGIKREMLGDILIDAKGCTTAAVKSVAKYLVKISYPLAEEPLIHTFLKASIQLKPKKNLRLSAASYHLCVPIR